MVEEVLEVGSGGGFFCGGMRSDGTYSQTSRTSGVIPACSCKSQLTEPCAHNGQRNVCRPGTSQYCEDWVSNC
jgi:hypothetical protein